MSPCSSQSCPKSTHAGGPLPGAVLQLCPCNVAQASRLIEGFSGFPALAPAPLTAVQSIVAATLPPDPLRTTKRWVRYSLAVVAGLARWADVTGQPLTAAHLLAVETRQRFLHIEKAHLCLRSRESYRSRLEIIALSHPEVTPAEAARAPHHAYVGPGNPLTEDESADLWMWASRLRPYSRRIDIQAMVALGLGTGLTQTGVAVLQGRHIIQERDTALIDFPGTAASTPRLIPARGAWGPRLASVAHEVAPNAYLVGNRSSPPQPGTLDQARWRANESSAPPVDWSPGRLRVTWLSQLIANGTSVTEVMRLAGLKTLGPVEAIIRAHSDAL